MPSRCSATASRLQQLTQLETARPHDNTPTGRRSPGLFVRFNPLPSHALQGWQGGTRCGMLDSMIQYNRPRRRDEVADFVAASSGDYTFLRLCGLRCAAAYLYLSAYRAHKHAHQLTRGRADARRSAGMQRAGQAQRIQREHAGHEQGREQAQGRGFTVRRCARGLGGAYDIGRDGTGSGSQLPGLTAADALRRADVR